MAGAECDLCEIIGKDDVPEGIRIATGRYADTYLRRTAVIAGHTVVVWNGRHVAEPTELSEEESLGYWSELVEAGRAVEAVFRPIKVNYMILGNGTPHLHTHVLPRYRGDPAPGMPLSFDDFEEMDPQDVSRWSRALKDLLNSE